MTERRPIVRINGRDQQIPMEDTVPPSILPVATTSQQGAMSAQDKQALDDAVEEVAIRALLRI